MKNLIYTLNALVSFYCRSTHNTTPTDQTKCQKIFILHAYQFLNQFLCLEKEIAKIFPSKATWCNKGVACMGKNWSSPSYWFYSTKHLSSSQLLKCFIKQKTRQRTTKTNSIHRKYVQMFFYDSSNRPLRKKDKNDPFSINKGLCTNHLDRICA